jgi:type III pantothenate kinase
MTTGPTLLAINVGNTSTHLGQFVEGRLEETYSSSNDHLPQLVENVASLSNAMGRDPRAPLLLASTNDTFAQRLASAVEDQLSVDVYRVGDDLPVPIGQDLDHETITGVDRLLNAAAAYDHVRQACVVVDAGTAVTIDFVDGKGTFHGGVIAPGAQMQLRSLHTDTAALPDLEFAQPDDNPFGKSTTQAMLQGVFNGIRGLIRYQVERYAEFYAAYPMVIATGGNAQTLLSDDPIVDRVVPQLTLLGIASAARHALAGDEDADVRR